MATGRKGQKYGTVGMADGVYVGAWVDRDKRELVKAHAASKELTVSALINKLLSIDMARSGVTDQSNSFDL